MKTTSQPSQNVASVSECRSWRREWLMLLVPAVVLIAFRLHAFGGPLETDECNYAYIGQRLLAGDDLYVDVWDHQPPGVFALFAGLIGLFGNSEAGFRVFASICAIASMVLVYGCCRPGLGVSGAWIAAMLFAVCSSDPGMAGEGCNREVFMNTLVLGALLLLLLSSSGFRAAGPPAEFSLPRVLAAGGLLGLASTIKTVIAAQWLVLLAAIWLIELGIARRSVIRAFKLTCAFALIPALIWVLLGLYYGLTDRFALFWEAVFAYNVEYSGIASGFLDRFGAFFTRWPVFRPALPLWLAAAVGLAVLIATGRRRDARWTLLVVALTTGSYLAVCMPGQFWNHYYLLMLPALVILAAGLYDSFTPTRPKGRTTVVRRPRTANTFAVILFGSLLVTQGLYYLLAPPDLIGFQRYKARMLWARDQGWRLASVTDPQDLIYVWGHADAGIYYYARRRCASRFTMIGGLLGDDADTRKQHELLLDDLARNRPRVILKALPFFPALERFVIDHGYVCAGWDHDRLEVLCDPARPIARVDWNWSVP